METGDPSPVSAKRIESRNELPGGPVQFGDEGDFLLQNSRIRVVVTDVDHAVSPALWGGGLADLDLVRPYSEFRPGNGLDQFFLALPMVNLNVPNPRTGGVEPLLTPDRAMGAIRVVGRGDRVLALLNLMDHPAAKLLGLKTRFAMATDHVMVEESRVLKMVTTFRALSDEDCSDAEDNDKDSLTDCEDPDCSLDPACPHWCSHMECPEGSVCDPFYGACLPECRNGSCDVGICDPLGGVCLPEAVAMNALDPGTNLVDVLSGGFISVLSGEKSEVTEHAGYIAGDMLLYGANLGVFVPGIGYELDAQYRLVFLRGGNPLTSPPSYDFMAGTGDRVSYAYFSLDGAVLFPFATESLTGSMTHGLNCLLSDEDDDVCDDVPFVRFTRYLVIGSGDVASVLETIYDLREEPFGTVRGQVVTQKEMEPVPDAQVFAISDPCDQSVCGQLPESCGDFSSYEELAAAARVCSATPENPDGIGMVASQFRTDRGMDYMPDGKFTGPLKPGTYYLVAKDGKRPLSAPARVEIVEGETTVSNLLLPPPAVLTYRALDQAADPVPVRVTIGHCFPECRGSSDCSKEEVCDGEFHCRPEEGCAADEDCDTDEVCKEGNCRCRLGRLPGRPWEELGDGYMTDRKVTVDFSISGAGEVELPPGRYDVVFSRGMEYSVDAREVDLRADHATFIDARVYKVVDTTSWISVDQHMHGAGSPDSSISDEDRLESGICDGLEVMVMTDHDFIKDLEPVIRELGLWEYVAAFPGEEVTTLDISHIIGWPLDYTNKLSNHGALNWVDKTPNDIFSWIREHGLLPPDETLVVIPHPRGGMSSYFDVFGLNPYNLELEQGMVQEQTPLLSADEFSPAFDMMEVANSKRHDILRAPTYREMIDYQVKRKEILAEMKGYPREEIVERLMPVSADAVRQFLKRTPEEQEAIWDYPGAPQCTLPAFCKTDGDCGSKAKCAGGTCSANCNDASDCGEGYECKEGGCTMPLNYPCNIVKGLTGDWLRMLSFGVFKPGVGGSDIHGLVNWEMGCLRNYVKSPVDDPVAVDLSTLAGTYRNGRSFLTYGPFVELDIDGKGPGETVSLEGGGGTSGELHIRVQSPMWFDVSRVEILRNGKMEYVFDTNSKDPAFAITVPNDGIVNLEATLPIAPDEDSWYLAFVMGLEGQGMAPVYGSLELPPVYLGDIFTSVFGALPIELPTYVVPIKLPVYYPQFPVAITNPIFVDVDGKDEAGCAISPPETAAPDWMCRYPADYPKTHIPCVCQ